MKQRLRVLFVIPYFYPAWEYGGQPKSAYELARGLVQLGHSVTVLTTDSGGPRRLPFGPERRPQRLVDGIHVYYYRNISNYLAYRHRIFLPRNLFKEIHAIAVGMDLIHIHELRSSLTIAGRRAAGRAAIPYALSAHGGLRRLGKQMAKSIFDFIWGYRVLQDAAAVVAISPVEAQDALHFGVPPDKIVDLPNSIRKEEYRNLPRHGEFKRRWNLESTRIVLFLGRLHWVKGADLLIAAFNTIYSSFPGVSLVIAGPDDGQEQQLRRQAALHHPSNRIVFTGHLDGQAKLEALIDSDVLVVPSRSEVFALTALEALLCGTPVLMSCACGLFPRPSRSEGVRQFKSEDVSSLALELSAFLRDGCPHDSQAGRTFVEAAFDSQAVSLKAEQVYRQIIAREVSIGEK